MKGLEYLKKEFDLCNNHRFLDKPVFWQIKAKILKSYGIFDGFDYKEIVDDCPVCKESKHYQPFCFNCNGTRYTITKKHYLRYKLFDSVYHLPARYEIRDSSLVFRKLVKKEKKQCSNRLELYLGLIKLAIVFSPEKLKEIVHTVTGKECVKKYRNEIKMFYRNQKEAA